MKVDVHGQEEREGDDLHDEDDDDEAEVVKTNVRPQTREELLKLRSAFRNNMHLSAFFYEDRQLQLQFRMIYLGSKPTIELYKYIINTLKKGQDVCAAHVGIPHCVDST